MALNIETSRQLRTVSDQERLVEAVRDAPAHEQETDSVEWKGAIDLTEKKWQAEIARQVIGFANRHPGRASSVWEGCSYLVLGAAPGVLPGVTPDDSATLDGTVCAYAGKDGPQWSPDYLTVDGAVVLVITVEPPRWGDPIFAFRKEFERYRDGDVFIRRNGKTERANNQEMRMLSDRAAERGTRLGIDLEWWDSPTEARAIDMSEDAVDAWITRERDALLASTGLLLLGRSRAIEAVSARDTVIERERSGHKTKVEKYLTEVRPHVREIWKAQIVALGLGQVELAVENQTEHNFADVDVFLEFDGDVWSAFDKYDIDLANAPPRPEPWASRESKLSPLSNLLRAESVAIPRLDYLNPSKYVPRGRSRDTGSTTLEFSSVDVRPAYRHRIGPAFLIASAQYAGQEIQGVWHATSKNASGIARGVFNVQVSAQSFVPKPRRS